MRIPELLGWQNGEAVALGLIPKPGHLRRLLSTLPTPPAAFSLPAFDDLQTGIWPFGPSPVFVNKVCCNGLTHTFTFDLWSNRAVMPRDHVPHQVKHAYCLAL